MLDSPITGATMFAFSISGGGSEAEGYKETRQRYHICICGDNSTLPENFQPSCDLLKMRKSSIPTSEEIPPLATDKGGLSYPSVRWRLSLTGE